MAVGTIATATALASHGPARTRAAARPVHTRTAARASSQGSSLADRVGERPLALAQARDWVHAPRCGPKVSKTRRPSLRPCFVPCSPLPRLAAIAITRSVDCRHWTLTLTLALAPTLALT